MQGAESFFGALFAAVTYSLCSHRIQPGAGGLCLHLALGRQPGKATGAAWAGSQQWTKLIPALAKKTLPIPALDSVAPAGAHMALGDMVKL